MKEKPYIYSAPWFGGMPFLPFDKIVAPLGQVELCLKILQAAPISKAEIFQTTAREYVAIMEAMEAARIKFFLAHMNGNPNLDEVAKIFEGKIGVGVIGFPEKIPQELVYWPRDMFVSLPEQKVILVNSQVSRLVKMTGNREYSVLFSPYGEGGAVLFRKNTMFVGRRYVNGGIKFRNDRALDILKRRGVNIIPLLSPVVRTFSRQNLGNKAGIDEHIDRSINLVEARDGSLHLIVDPNIHLADSQKESNEFVMHGPENSLDIIGGICEPFDIDVHCPKKIEVPYSIGFMQFDDGRVLMTEGDKSVASVIEKIVGPENVIKTSMPIALSAVLGRAGIRCTINELTEQVFNIFP